MYLIHPSVRLPNAIMVSVSPVHLPLGQSCMSMKTMYMNIWYANMVHCRWKLCLKREMLQCPTSPETLSNWLMLQAQSHAITAWQRLCPYYVVQTQQLSFMIKSCSAMCRGTCHKVLYTFFMKIHSWLLIGTYHRHVDPVLCLDHPLFPLFVK